MSKGQPLYPCILVCSQLTLGSVWVRQEIPCILDVVCQDRIPKERKTQHHPRQPKNISRSPDDTQLKFKGHIYISLSLYLSFFYNGYLKSNWKNITIDKKNAFFPNTWICKKWRKRWVTPKIPQPSQPSPSQPSHPRRLTVPAGNSVGAFQSQAPPGPMCPAQCSSMPAAMTPRWLGRRPFTSPTGRLRLLGFQWPHNKNWLKVMGHTYPLVI